MPNRGGSGTIAGIEFQLWFTATKLADAFFDESLSVHPEADVIDIPEGLANEKIILKEQLVYVNDLVTTKDYKVTHYNLKYVAPDVATWTVNALLREKVLHDFLVQHKRTPDARLIFVSQSPCPLFQQVFHRAANARSVNEIKQKLGSEKNRNAWASVKLKSTGRKSLPLSPAWISSRNV